MPASRSEAWLTAHVKSERTQQFVGGILSIVAAILVCYVSLVIIKLMVQFIAYSLKPLLGLSISETVAWGISTGVLALLFYTHATTRREYWEDLTIAPTGKKHVTIHIPGVGYGSTRNPLDPSTMRVVVKLMADLMFVGPRIVRAAIKMLRKSKRLKIMDLTACAAVLDILLASPDRMSFEEIIERLPTTGTSVVFDQLQDIRGVLFLVKDPPGLSLMPKLRSTIASASH